MIKFNDKKGATVSSDPAAIIDDRFAALFKREEFQQDENAEDFKLRNPSKGLNSRGKKRGGGDDSDDELQGMYDAVDEDNSSDGSDDNMEDDGGPGAFDDDGADDDDDDDEEEEEYRRSKKVRGTKRGRGKSGSGDDDAGDDEGQIYRASKKANELAEKLRQRQQQAHGSWKNSFGGGTSGTSSSGSSGSKSRSQSEASAKGGSGTGPRMYELSDGIASSKAIFGHADEHRAKRGEERALGSVPLSQRLGDDAAKSSTQVCLQRMRVMLLVKISCLTRMTYLLPLSMLW